MNPERSATGFWSPSPSPDGSALAFVTDASGRPQAWVRRPGGACRRLTGVPGGAQQVAWSPDGSLLACATGPAGGRASGVALVPPDGGEPAPVCGDAAEVHLGGWGRDGDLYVAVRAAGAEDLAACVRERGGRLRRVRSGREYAMVSDAAGGRLAVGVVHGPGWRSVEIVDEAAGRSWPLCEVGEGDALGGAVFAPGGRALHVVTTVGRELAAFGVAAVDDGRRPPEVVRARDGAELETFAVAADAPVALLGWNVGGTNRLEVLDLLSGAVVGEPELPEELLWSADLSPDGARALLTLAGSTTGPGLWTLDMARLRVAPLLRPAAAGGVRPVSIEVEAHDGLVIQAWRYDPPAPRGACVVSMHGGPAAQERPEHNPMYQALLREGVAVLAPNVRGSTGFGRRFQHLDDREGRLDARRDVVSCLRYAAAAGLATGSRLGVLGASFGGYLALCAMVDAPELVGAGAVVSAIPDLAGFLRTTEPWMRSLMEPELGRLPDDEELLARLSPIHQVERVRAPLLVLHGTEDPVVRASEAERLVAALRGRGAAVTFHLFRGEGHGLQRQANSAAAARMVARWFRRHLGGRR